MHWIAWVQNYVNEGFPDEDKSATMTNLYIEPKFDNIQNSKRSAQKCLVLGQKL